MNINSWVQGLSWDVKVELKIHAIQIYMCAHECRRKFYKFNIGFRDMAFLLYNLSTLNCCSCLFVKRLQCNCLPVAGSKVLKQNQVLWPMVCSRWHFISLFMTDVDRKSTYKNRITKSVPLVLKNNVKYIKMWHTLCCLNDKLAKVVWMKYKIVIHIASNK